MPWTADGTEFIAELSQDAGVASGAYTKADVGPGAAAGLSGYGLAGAMALSGIASLFTGSAQVRAGRAQKKMMEYNSRVADLQSVDALLRGDVAAKRQGRITNKVIGVQRAAYAAQGVTLDVGSQADVEADTVFLGKLEEMRIRNNAARESWGYKVQARDLSMRGQYAMQTSQMQAIDTLLTSGSRLALAKYGFGRSPLATDPTITR